MLIALLPPSVFASLPPPDSAASAGWLLLAIGAVAVAVDRVLSIFTTVRKLKGVDPAADARYASKDDHDSLGARVSGLETEMRLLNTTVANELRAVNRSLGRLEGAAGTIKQ